jgi:hypothetical protein
VSATAYATYAATAESESTEDLLKSIEGKLAAIEEAVSK